MLFGFIDDEHRTSFNRARLPYQFGAPGRAMCGARTRGGNTCKSAPLAGHHRCLKHAGPKAARAYRDAQLKDLAAGRLHASSFAEAERKRAANRLRWLWKKHSPWVLGSTIDLGAYEDRFRVAVAEMGHQVESLPPAVSDWARWRYRRLMIDRARPTAWAELRGELMRRVDEAGEPEDGLRGVAVPVAAITIPEQVPAFSRRRLVDIVRPVVGSQECVSKTRSRFDELPELGADEAALILFRHRAELAPALAKCQCGDQRIRVAAAYKLLLDEPDSRAAHKVWLNVIRSLDPI